MNLSRPFILRPVATALLMAALLLSGILSYRLLPVSALPQVDYPTIRIITFYPGASPEVMTSSVTAPLERQFGQLPGLAQMSSTSSGGASVITLRFELEKPLSVAEQEVQAAMNAANSLLPNDLPQPPVYNKVNPADTPVLTLAVTSRTVPLPQIHDLVDTRVAQKLSQLPGVGLVSIAGGQRPAVRIQANPQALASNGLNLQNIRAVIAAANVNQPKGSFDGPQRSFTLDANDQLRSPEAYKDADRRLPRRRADPPPGRRRRRRRRREPPTVGVGQRPAGGADQRPAPARRQRHRGRRPHPGAAAAAHRQPAVDAAGGGAERPHGDHPRLGRGRAARADLRHRPGRPGHVPVPAQRPGDDHPERRGAAVAGRHLRRDVRGRLLDQQPDADGADHRHRLRRRRRHRHGREHRPPHRDGRDAVPGRAQGRRGDRLHAGVADRLADRRADPAALHGRRGRPAVPRVRDHAGGLDPDLAGRVADADADDGRAPAQAPARLRAGLVLPPDRARSSTASSPGTAACSGSC